MSAQLIGNWNYPTKIISGPGRVKELPQLCGQFHFKNPMLVTDKGLGETEMMRGIRDLFSAANIPLGFFSGVKGNPTESNVAEGLAQFRAGKHDSVICVGGGSSLDVGKTIAFMNGQTRPMWDFEDIGDWWTRADVNGIAPNIAVPTTAGTGSDVGRASVILNETTHEKKIIFHPKMMPSVAIHDPELSVGMPKFLTVATGMDAIAHCIEAFATHGFHPLADGIAMEGLVLAKTYLPRAAADGKDLEARSRMLAVAAMGATAFQKGLGAVHSVSHPVGSFYDAHHGLTNGVMLPYVFAWNRSVLVEKGERIARSLGLKNQTIDGVIDWLLQIREELGVPHTLKDLKVQEKDFKLIAEHALRDPTASANPKPMTLQCFEQLVENAYTGKVR